jgi:peptidyl-tRNA hydrolase
MDPAAYVLQDFSADEGLLLEETLGRAVTAIETWLIEGVKMAMSRHNSGPDCL